MNRSAFIHTISPSSLRLKGFTLLEVMVALAIIALVMTTVFRMQSQTISMNIDARFYSIAPLLAKKVIAQVESGKEPAEDGTGGFEDTAFSDYTWTRSVEDVDFDTETFSDSEKGIENIEGLKKIDVTIRYEDRLTYTIRAYRYIPEEK